MKISYKKLKVYLAGAMEHAKLEGAGWRIKITPLLEKLGLEVLNPCLFEPEQLKNLRPARLPEYYTDLSGNKIKPIKWHMLKDAKEPNLYARFLKYMHRIIRFDINIVENVCDIVIVYWDKETGRGAGTHSELTAAFLKNKPIYCVTDTSMPAWAKACCTEIFLTFDALEEFLKDEYDYSEEVPSK